MKPNVNTFNCSAEAMTKTLNKKPYFVNLKKNKQKPPPQFKHFEMLIAAFA